MSLVQVVRLYDPSRRPASWMQIVRVGQFAVFAKDLESGAACGADGRPFADPSQATCAIADTLAEAQAFAATAVANSPSLRIDIFDHEGRARPALLTVLHPSRAQAADTHPRVLRKRRVIAWTLIAAAIPLLAFAIVERHDREIILPAFLGINMLIAAGRLLWFNLGVREIERARHDRLREHARPPGPPPHER
jgi:hypothetical protein